ncbi:MAG TPA: multiheme c-type cytochrome [Blastocatellia bacterium]|nr:multiheme c-type cytochrome [Blastocatellia bacterium]
MTGTAKKKLQLAVILTFLAVLGVSAARFAEAQDSPPSPIADWRPGHPANGWRFVGPKACAECHAAKFKTQTASHMGRALFAPGRADVLRDHPKLIFRAGKYNFLLARDGDRIMYTVSDGTKSLSLPVAYVFGDADMGQTYVLQHEGKFYEGRVSYYPDIKGLDLTMGHDRLTPTTLVEAMGREMRSEETRACFRCHSTNAVSGNSLQLDQLVEGVTCESCHGPGEKHVAAMRAGDLARKQIFNPKRLSTEEVSNFCGTCHRTWAEVAGMGLLGVQNVRFQPYRLTNSKCYDVDDPRISCTACHDPHESPRHDTAFFDSKCTACHNAAGGAAPAALKQSSQRVAPLCPVGRTNCISCHMPKIELPGSHFKFSDHNIRIVRPGDLYPD